MDDIRRQLEQLKETHNLRRIPPRIGGSYIDLSGNDYLGLALEAPSFEEEFLDLHRGRPLLFTSAASRLLSTRQDSHYLLEENLSEAYGRPSLLFNSGYHANVGIIGSLASLPDTVFIADKLVHASIIDGLRQSGANFTRFRHNDIASLRKLISREENARRIVVVTESVFSMDGDLAPLRELVELKKEDGRILTYIDEAHAFGVFGEKGLGLTVSPEISPYIDIMVGTFGKAGASYGAFVITRDRDLKDWILNTARSFIFSTALPPVTAEWSRFMFGKIMEADDRRQRLEMLSEAFRELITTFQRHSEAPNGNILSTTQIIPYLTGSSEQALKLSSRLRESGILALAIRRPTVPPGTERIRFSLHAGLPEIETFSETIKRVLTLAI